MATLTYGNHSVDVAKLPESAINALLSRGFNHVMGNEVASKVTTWKAKDENADASESAIAAKTAEFRDAALESLINGTIGTRKGSGGFSPVESLARANAVKEIMVILKKENLKMPTGDDKVTFGDGQSFTRAELIDRRMAKHGDRLMKAAEQELRRTAKTAEAESASDL